MPFSEIAGLIAGVVKHFAEGRQLRREAFANGRAIHVGDYAGLMRLKAGEQSGPGGGALRRVAERGSEAHALLIEPAVVWGVDRTRNQGCLLIRHEDKDIRTPLGSCKKGKSGEKRASGRHKGIVPQTRNPKSDIR